MSQIHSLRRNIRILVLNPNSSRDMTVGMEKAITRLNLPDTLEITTYTAPPQAPSSINNDVDIARSSEIIENDEHLFKDLARNKYDVILIACFSQHSIALDGTLTLGIFPASIMTSLSVLSNSHECWGIVTTGKFWEKHLTDGVMTFLGQNQGADNWKFAGVFSTGLNAGDLHSVAPEVVRERLKDATKALIRSDMVGCVVMGCAGMAGLEDIIRTAAAELNGPLYAGRLHVLDAVQAGILQAEMAVRSRRASGGY